MPATLQQIYAIFLMAAVVLIPLLVMLHTYTERSKPRGIGLWATAKAVGRKGLINTFWWMLALLVVMAAIESSSYGPQLDAMQRSWPLGWFLFCLAANAVQGWLFYYAWRIAASKAIPAEMSATAGLPANYLRGAQVVDGQHRLQNSLQHYAKFQKSKKKQEGHYLASVRLGGLYLPRESEMLHTMIVGSSGSGKSVLMRGLFSSIREREEHTGERGFVLDPDGGYTSRYYRAGIDTILNPFDARSVQWGPFLDIKNHWDIDNLAAALVPGRDKWDEMARTLVSSVIEILQSTAGAKAKDIYDICVLATPEEQAEILKGTPAARYFVEGNERARESIITTATTALAPLRALTGEDRFSIVDWVQSGRGWLFLPYSAEQIASLRSLYSIWTRLGIFAVLSLPERDNGLWFAVDEFDALGKINGMSDALPRLRKFGGRVLLGLQTIGMVDALYGQGYSDAIAENCGNTVILRCKSGDKDGTSIFASRQIGKREIRRQIANISESRGSSNQPGKWLSSSSTNRSVSRSEQIATEDVVMPAEIEQLPIGAGYIKFATEAAWHRVQFPAADSPKITDSFVPKI